MDLLILWLAVPILYWFVNGRILFEQHTGVSDSYL